MVDRVLKLGNKVVQKQNKWFDNIKTGHFSKKLYCFY